MSKAVPNTAWRELISRLMKSEMSKRGLRYDDLSKALAEHGCSQSADNLRNKINRGILGADLFVQLLIVMNVKSLNRETLLEILEELKN